MIMINSQSLLSPGDGPIVLIIAPTRELALQIQVSCFIEGRIAPRRTFLEDLFLVIGRKSAQNSVLPPKFVIRESGFSDDVDVK